MSVSLKSGRIKLAYLESEVASVLAVITYPIINRDPLVIWHVILYDYSLLFYIASSRIQLMHVFNQSTVKRVYIGDDIPILCNL
jgi:hypothetical protein